MTVFKMNDYDWMASGSKNEAITRYRKDYGDVFDEDVVECDIDSDTMWYGFDVDDRRFLSLLVSNPNKHKIIKKGIHGDFDFEMRVTFAEALYLDNEKTKTYMICSTEF